MSNSNPFFTGSFTLIDVKDICFDSDLGLYLSGSFIFTSGRGDVVSSDRVYVMSLGKMFSLSLMLPDDSLLNVNPFVSPLKQKK